MTTDLIRIPTIPKSTITDFDFIESIGEGSYGVVFRVRRKIDDRFYVIKQINLSGMTKKEQLDILQEVHILAALDHSCIIRYYDSFISEDKRLNIVMEYASQGTLDDVISRRNGKKLPEKKIWRYLLEILHGLNYVHNQKILHRDMKTMNIFLDENDHVKIGDFGVSRVLSHTRSLARTLVGTPYYLSPELCENKPYAEKSDIWAVGCILYEMCTFKHPFEATNQAALILKILKGKYTPIGPFYSSDLSKLVQCCLTLQPEKRPCTEKLLSMKIVIDKSKECGVYNHLKIGGSPRLSAINRKQELGEPKQFPVRTSSRLSESPHKPKQSNLRFPKPGPNSKANKKYREPTLQRDVEAVRNLPDIPLLKETVPIVLEEVERKAVLLSEFAPLVRENQLATNCYQTCHNDVIQWRVTDTNENDNTQANTVAKELDSLQ